ncbi:MAG: di-heme oxidoredictase family protein [Candidatus Methylomirabilaceae bacterium]
MSGVARWAAVAALLSIAACQRSLKLGDPVRGLTADQRTLFDRGRVVFDSVFTPTTGLGPTFNSVACGECHEDPVAGGVGDEVEVHASAFRPPICDPLVQEGGIVIHQQVTPALKAALGIDSEPFPPSATGRALRTSPVVFGRGLLDLVPDSVILSYADSADRNGDSISGRPNRFFDGRLGRFGRKALVPTLQEFNAGAFPIEMGVTTPATPREETIGGNPIPPGVDPVPEPEINQEAVDLTDAFVRFLAAPTPLKANSAARRGRELFGSVGCAGCHIPTLRTGSSPIDALSNKDVAAYTDLLLHDMGPDLADICLTQATPAEFRTEPLIGLRAATQFLHDGRAKSLEQAIQLHGGESARARDGFLGLSETERAALIAFLKTL